MGKGGIPDKKSRKNNNKDLSPVSAELTTGLNFVWVIKVFIIKNNAIEYSDINKIKIQNPTITDNIIQELLAIADLTRTVRKSLIKTILTPPTAKVKIIEIKNKLTLISKGKLATIKKEGILKIVLDRKNKTFSKENIILENQKWKGNIANFINRDIENRDSRFVR